MRNALLLLLVVVAAATWLFALTGGGGTARAPEPELLPSVLASRSVETRDDDRDRSPPMAKPLAQPTPARPAPVAKADRRSLEGTVTDRFGHPIVNERVYLLRPDQGYPPPGVDLAFYVTALTSRSGQFSLSAPDEGPWRLAVGPRGKPRVDPSDLRSLNGNARAEVTVPGAAGIRVLLDGVPRDGSHISVELVALSRSVPSMKPLKGGARGGAKIDTRGNSDRKSTPNRRNRRGNTDGADSRGVFRNESGSDGAESAGPRLATETVGVALASLTLQNQGRARDKQEEAGEEEKAKRNNRGGRNRQGQGSRPGRGNRQGEKEKADGGSDPKEGKIDEPFTPPERWVSVHRHLVTEEELSAGVAEFSGLEGGSIVRLRLRVGKEQIEGEHRFTLIKDAITEVRIISAKVGPGAALVYSSSLQMLPADERPKGIRWADQR